ncbi:MAG: tRNA (5-methylaminomethyl-2-thiouridine)(34)-methyltransferase MnmD [Caulobacteraceae bacterium]
MSDPDAPAPRLPAESPPTVGASLDWTATGPRSRQFGDVYFSAVDGLAESRAVFLEGCGLPDAWRDRTRFVIAELGFGTGLNILAVMELWRTTRPAAGHLNIFSVEAYPLSRADAAQALAAWPELGEIAALLLDAWPSDRRGLHRVDFPTLGATLDLWIGEATDGLAAWTGAADAWFLDGFAPSVNPGMWSEALLAQVAARAAPGARIATFTVAGAVRRGLTAAGFAFEKKPGFGRKRERLEAWLPAAGPPPTGAPKRIAIVGAGIAGAALARSLRLLGHSPILIEAVAPGAGASGNPVALVTPRLDAGLGVGAELHAQAFAHATALYRRETPAAVMVQGALQLEGVAKDAGRFDRIAAWNGFATGAVTRLTPQEAAERLDEPTAAAGLAYAEALVIEPIKALAVWLEDVEVVAGEVASLVRHGDGWRLLDASGAVISKADAVVLAAGPACLRLAPLALMPVRGQACWTHAVPFTGAPGSFGSYALPLPDGGTLFGATHGREDWGTELRDEDEARNLDQLAQGRPALAARIEASRVETPLQGRASLRASTPDHAPLAGRLEDDLYVLTGLGARGFTLAPLLAEHIAALIDGGISPLPADIARAVDPQRYCGRTKAGGGD